MTRDEYLAHDASVAAATKLTPTERSALGAARTAREQAREEAEAARMAWATAEGAKYQAANRNEKARRRLDDLEADMERTAAAHNLAHRHAHVVEIQINFSRDTRVRFANTQWQMLVDERARQTPLPSIATQGRVRVFDSEEQRDATYAARAAG
jgi:hypothetical protein